MGLTQMGVSSELQKIFDEQQKIVDEQQNTLNVMVDNNQNMWDQFKINNMRLLDLSKKYQQIMKVLQNNVARDQDFS